MKLTSSVFLILTTAGCFVPRPEHYQRIPKIRGVVLKSRSPIQNARVWYSENWSSCESHSAEALSESDGTFELIGLTKFRLGAFITGGDPGVHWALCIQPDANSEVLHYYESVMGYEAPFSMEYRCDVLTPQVCERTCIRRLPTDPPCMRS